MFKIIISFSNEAINSSIFVCTLCFIIKEWYNLLTTFFSARNDNYKRECYVNSVTVKAGCLTIGNNLKQERDTRHFFLFNLPESFFFNVFFNLCFCSNIHPMFVWKKRYRVSKAMSENRIILSRRAVSSIGEWPHI